MVNKIDDLLIEQGKSQHELINYLAKKGHYVDRRRLWTWRINKHQPWSHIRKDIAEFFGLNIHNVFKQ